MSDLYTEKAGNFFVDSSHSSFVSFFNFLFCGAFSLLGLGHMRHVLIRFAYFEIVGEFFGVLINGTSRTVVRMTHF